MVFWFVLYAWAALGAGFGAVLLVATIWRRCSSIGALAGLMTGPLVVVLLKTVFKLSAFLYELPPASGFAVLATMIGSALAPDRPGETKSGP